MSVHTPTAGIPVVGTSLDLDMRICLQSVEVSFGIREDVITDAKPHCVSDSQAIGAGLIKGADSIGVISLLF